MRHFKFFGILALLCSLAVPAQTAERKGSPWGELAPGSVYTAYVLGEMSAAIGDADAPTLYRAGVDSARAVIVDGQSAILYNPEFFEEIATDAGTDWAAVSVLAHELGHHHYGHVREGVRGYPTSVSRRHELEADYFSGYVLAKLGTTREEAEAAQRTYFDEHATATHPASPQRLRAIAAGWADAEEGRGLAASPAELIGTSSAKVVPPSPKAVIAAMTRRFVPEEGW
jgi:hypothetical protein